MSEASRTHRRNKEGQVAGVNDGLHVCSTLGCPHYLTVYGAFCEDCLREDEAAQWRDAGGGADDLPG